MRYIYDLKFGILQVRENEISPRISSGDIAHLYSCARQKKHWLRYNFFSTNKKQNEKGRRISTKYLFKHNSNVPAQ